MPDSGKHTNGLTMADHISTIDTLRAIAISCVFAHHLSVYTGFHIPYLDMNGGLIGVQLFFLISGYLIIQSAIKYPWRVFAIHRIFRIFPPYLVALSIFTLVKYLLINDFRIVFNERWPYFLLNLLNLQLLHPVSVLLLDSIHVGWSLTVELFWYILAPALIWMTGRNKNGNIRWMAALVLSVALSTIWVYLASRGMLNFLYESSIKMVGVSLDNERFRHSIVDNAPPAQLMYFLIGASLYLFRQPLTRIPSSILWVSSSLILLFVPNWNLILGVFPNVMTGIGCAAFMLWLRRFGIHDKLTLWIAKVSYSIYLIHVPVMLIVFKYFNLSGWTGLIVATSTIMICSEISWRLIEAPSQQFGKRLAEKFKR